MILRVQFSVLARRFVEVPVTCVDEVLTAKEEQSRLRREAEAHRQQLFEGLSMRTR